MRKGIYIYITFGTPSPCTAVELTFLAVQQYYFWKPESFESKMFQYLYTEVKPFFMKLKKTSER